MPLSFFLFVRHGASRMRCCRRAADGAAVLFLFALLVLVGAPLIAQTVETEKQQQTACMSNLKQIGLAMMLYAQDYDEKLPLPRSEVRMNARRYEVGWGAGQSLPTGPPATGGAIFPYVRDHRVFRCPAVKTRKTLLTYMLSDLAAGASFAILGGPQETVLVAEGEDVARNVGHAYVPDAPPAPAVFPRSKKVIRLGPGMGARVQSAPTRHAGGANYAYADAHVKWHKPTEIYFPPRRSNAQEGKEGRTPIPGGNMLGFRGTFLLH